MRMFLKAYAECGRVGEACETVEVSRDLHYQWLEKDPAYRDAFEQTKYRVGQLIEDKVIELAMNGEVSLLLPVLRRFRPEYRERTSIEHSGSVDLVERMRAADQRLIALQRNAPPTGTDGR
jgi:hypothetical protein